MTDPGVNDDDFLLLYGSVEKPVVVVEIGFLWTRAGFAGEHIPRVKRHTRLLFSRAPGHPFQSDDLLAALPHAASLTATDWQTAASSFLSSLFLDSLCINPSERRVLLCSGPWLPLPFRNALARALLSSFSVSSLVFSLGPVAALLPLGLRPPSALVLDFGHKYISAVPIFEGFGIRRAIRSVPFPGVDLLKHLQEHPGPLLELPPFVAPLLVRETASMLLDVFLLLPIDTRCLLARNLLLIGGLPMIGRSRQNPSGLVGDLLGAALAPLICEEPRYRVLEPLLPALQDRSSLISSGVYSPDTLAWVGASMLGAVFPAELRITSYEEISPSHPHHWAQVV